MYVFVFLYGMHVMLHYITNFLRGLSKNC